MTTSSSSRTSSRRRGLNYSVAEVQEEADLEFPADTTGDGNPDFDARLLMRDVILVRQGIQVNASGSENYPQNVRDRSTRPRSARSPSSAATRGSTSRRVRGRTEFRFVNTHLEAFNATFRNFQAQNLTIGSGVTDVAKPVVLVGDLNSDPDDPTSDPPQPRRRCEQRRLQHRHR